MSLLGGDLETDTAETTIIRFKRLKLPHFERFSILWNDLTYWRWRK